MTLIIQRPAPGTRWADTLSHITPAEAQALKADGFVGVFLYAEQVTQADLDACFGAGLLVAFVMWSPAPGYHPTVDLAQQMANGCVNALNALGIPAGASIFIDLETMGGLPAERIAFANAASDVFSAHKFVPGAYIGDGVGLTSAELYNLHVVRYYKGASIVMDRNGLLAEPLCGWCIVQGLPFNYMVPGGGPTVDLDCVWQDYRGRTVEAVCQA